MSSRFVKRFENRVRNVIRKYKLLDSEDRVFVACSGGKDSTAVLYLLDKFGYKPEGIMVDLGIGDWSKTNRENLEKFCRVQDLTLHTVDGKKELGYSLCYLKSLIMKKTGYSQCHICGILKRWMLNRTAKKLDATKLAFGHNLDDEAQTGLMNIFNGNAKIGLNIGPKTGVREYPGFVTRIKPMFFMPEKDIRKYSEEIGFRVLYRRCPCAQDSYRAFLRDRLNEWEKDFPEIKEKIVDSTLKLIQSVRDSGHERDILKCEKCGEPSNNRVCKACSLLAEIR